MVKLTKTMADIIASRCFNRRKPPEWEKKGQSYEYRSKYLNVLIENDWFDKDGLISVNIGSTGGAGEITIKLDPKTLEPVQKS